MSARLMSRMTTDERDFTNDPSNFTNEDQRLDFVKNMKVGDEAHEHGESLIESTNHRLVQDYIYRNGFNGYNDESHHDYSWNSLHSHSAGTVAGTVRGGFAFDEAFYYDKKDHHHYLTRRAQKYLDDNKEPYFKKGTYSVIKPEPKKEKYHNTGHNSTRYNDSGFGPSQQSGECSGLSTISQSEGCGGLGTVPQFSGGGEFSDQEMYRMTEQVMKQMSRFS